jgi:phosphoglycerate kinase
MTTLTLPQLMDIPEPQSQRIFVRTDFNVPLRDGKIENDFRIQKSLPTLKWLHDEGARIIIGSHLWGDEATTLRIVYERLQELLPDVKVTFAADFNEAEDQITAMDDGDIVLLENLRYYEGEQSNSEEFAKKLADLAESYVNDAFPVSHRKHASIVGVPRFLPSYAGLQFMKEVENLSLAFDPPKPFLFILGGAKFETKVPLIAKFLPKADHVFVSGALVNAFFQARGYEVGDSLVPKEKFDLFDMLENPKLVLPRDVVVVKDGETSVKLPDEVSAGEVILDVGPEAMEQLEELLEGVRFVLWNGPLGNTEKGSGDTTYELARLLANSDAETVLGGGDTVAAITNLNNEDSFTFVSTAGGAMLDFLAQETLPGIEAIQGKNS